jgi:hypothetical protein
MSDATQFWLIALACLIVVALVFAAIAYVVLKWLAMKIAVRVAEEAERRVAIVLGAGLKRAGVPDRRPMEDEKRRRYLAEIDRLAWWMDDMIRLPVIGGIGLDSVLGLLPVAGDVISFGISAMIVVRAARMGAPRELLTRLIAMQITDLLLGSIPVAGDIFDAAYRADLRGAAIVREWADQQQ